MTLLMNKRLSAVRSVRMSARVLFSAVAAVLSVGVFPASAASVVKPTARQLEWADCEIGVIIHQDVQVYDQSYVSHTASNLPPASVFNPTALDTDQWIETAVQAGATYAVLVAKHCSGFSLWPTKAHGYSVASSPWKGGKGDIVADFIASCRKYGVRPGLYASTGRNGYCGLYSPSTKMSDEQWKRYVDVVKTQLGELWSKYGELFEIWFDGGMLPEDRGGREIEEMLKKLQPNALVFQGKPEKMMSLRWTGNERAHAAEACWNRTNLGTNSMGLKDELGERFTGRPDGRYWCPAEADTPNRDAMYAFQGGWFWRPGEDGYVFPAETLLDRYMTSVGRNCNLLIGMVIDNRGLVPDADVREFRRFGQLVKDMYSRPVGSVSGKGFFDEQIRTRRFEIDVPGGMKPSLASIREDLTNGENVRCFAISGYDGKVWRSVAHDWNIGHRRLVRFRPGPYSRFRLDVWGFAGNPDPVIRDFSLYE